MDDEKEDPTRIGETIMCVTDDANIETDGKYSPEERRAVWSRLLELAGFPKLDLRGWVPLFEASTSDPGEIEKARQANGFIAAIVAVPGTNEDGGETDEPYWKDIEAMWALVQEQKAKNS